MIVKLRMLLEYHCYPVWLYDENDRIIDTLLPEELRDDTEPDAKFDDLKARYDALFIDDGIEFSVKGFEFPKERLRFLKDWGSAVSELRSKTGGRYEIVDDIAFAWI